MSKIATVVAGSPVVRVEQRFGRLELVATLTGAASAADLNAALALIAAGTIEVNKQTRNGSSTIIQKSSIPDLLVLALANDGVLATSFDTGGTVKIRGAIELTNQGSIPLQDGEFFEVSFSLPAALSIDVYAMDFDILSSTHNVYERVYFNANSPREISVHDAQALAIRKTELDKIEFVFADGARVIYALPEVVAIARDYFGVIGSHRNVAERAPVTFDDMDLLVIGCAPATFARVTLNTSSTIYKLSQEEL